MVKVLLKGGILGGLVLFLWCGISWMYIPWHAKTFNNFQNEAEVTKVITAQVSHSGIYTIPGVSHHKESEEEYSTGMKGPLVFAVVRLENNPPMNRLLVNELMIQILAAFLVTGLMTRVKEVSYMGRVGLVTLFGLTAALVSYLPLWNWFSFSTVYTAVEMADLIIGWYFAGFVIAWATRDK